MTAAQTRKVLTADFTTGSSLPEGWASAVLSDIGHWTTGGTPSRRVASYFGDDIPFVKSGDLNDAIVVKTEEALSNEGLEQSSAKLLPVGTVSIALYGATIGKLGVLGIPAATNQACANCEVFSDVIDRSFLFLHLMRERKALIEAGQGGAQPNINNRIVRNWLISLPPLAEQKRIVAKVEELFEELNKVRNRLDKASEILKRFRRSVLAAACSGLLTEDWRAQNLSIG